jgi:hypothetical protein
MFEDIVKLLDALLSEAKEAASVLLVSQHISMRMIDILVELTDNNENNELIVLAMAQPTASELVALLLQKGIDQKYPRYAEVIRISEDLIPDSLTRLLFEKRIKQNGQIWVIHLYDPDDILSCPHAHNLETGLKLHLGNGGLYSKKKLVGKIGRKKLIKLRNMIKDIDLPPLEP